MSSTLATQEAAATMADCIAGLSSAVEPVAVALVGIGREEAVELAEQVERLARVTYLLQLHVARAVNDAAPRGVSSGAGALVDYRVDSGIAANAGVEDCAEPVTSPDPSPSPYRRGCDLLRVRLRISGAEARRRIKAAADLLPGQTLTGEDVPARQGQLGAVLGAGVTAGANAETVEALGIGSESVGVIRRILGRVAEVAPREVVESVEATMTTWAMTFDPEALGKIGARILNHIDPDGLEPTDARIRERQGVRIGATWKGLTHLDVWADALQLETLLTVFDTGTNPRPGRRGSSVGSTGDGQPSEGQKLGEGHVRDGRPGESQGSEPHPTEGSSSSPAVSDGRTRSQVMLDVLVSACAAALRVGGLREVGGLPPQVMVTMAYRDLVDGLVGSREGPPRVEHGLIADLTDPTRLSSSAQLPHAGPIPARRVRHLACDADLIPIVLGTDNRILDLGRSHRLVTPALRRALIARDGGCLFPGCNIPATWTEAHHLVEWYAGGVTSLDNLVLLCSHHHHAVHTGVWRITGPANRATFTPVWPGLSSLIRAA